MQVERNFGGGKMRLFRRFYFVTIAFMGSVLVVTFQNCAPAKISGPVAILSSLSESGEYTVGAKVNLNSLMSSPAESSTNILYPSSSLIREARYSVNEPVIENLIIKNNDFTRIEWVQASNAMVISNGSIFSPRFFSPDLLGMVLIYGYRGVTPYYLGQIRFSGRGPSTLNANSVGAVTLNQNLVSSDATSESFQLDVNTPDVDVKTIQYTLSSGEVIGNQRGLLITKKRADNLAITVLVTDTMNQSFSRQLSFPATAVAPAPSPIATPSPNPAPASPDLTVSAITWTPAVPFAGDDVKFYASIKNVGTAASPSGTVMSVQFFVDGQPVTLSNTNVAPLDPGATMVLAANTSSLGLSTWHATLGNHQVRAGVDSAGQITESNETNNSLTMSLNVTAPLVITAAPTANSVTSTTAHIAWSLNHTATGQVQYGLTSAYGSFSQLESSFAYSTQNHDLVGLTPGALYHFRIVSTDQNGSQVISQDSTFIAIDNSWTRCALENETCLVPGARVVRFGVPGAYQMMTVTGTVGCNIATFGDPATGVLKSCEYTTTESIVHIRTRLNNASNIDASAPTNGVQMQIWTAYSSPTQDFKFTAASELSVFGKCLVATSATSGTPLVLADCTGATNQKWSYVNSTGELKNSNGLCVDVGYSSVTNGTKLTIFTCHGGANQKWDLLP
jgi:hypothetical protein